MIDCSYSEEERTVLAEIKEGKLWIEPETEDEYLLALGWISTKMDVRVLVYNDNEETEE